MTKKNSKKEVWKDILGYEGVYQISSHGRVYSVRRDLYISVYEKNTYSYVSLSFKNKRKHIRLHKIVAQHFIPNPKNKPQINHINGKKNDNRVINLEWCTAKENSEHATKFGLRNMLRKMIVTSLKGRKKRTLHSTTELIKFFWPKVKDADQIREKRELIKKVLYTDKKILNGYKITVE